GEELVGRQGAIRGGEDLRLVEWGGVEAPGGCEGAGEPAAAGVAVKRAAAQIYGQVFAADPRAAACDTDAHDGRVALAGAAAAEVELVGVAGDRGGDGRADAAEQLPAQPARDEHKGSQGSDQQHGADHGGGTGDAEAGQVGLDFARTGGAGDGLLF